MMLICRKIHREPEFAVDDKETPRNTSSDDGGHISGVEGHKYNFKRDTKRAVLVAEYGET